ncbi:MAG: Gfo/Idh/MocA family oxidoreductase [Candidatus Sumerlaeia bacterium]|nr:Gfo/Idh/MocA family oxidoreductase [Candidatus Sumerlaeia bacterium]
MRNVQNALSRRNFLKSAAASAAGLMIVPRHAVAGSGKTPPSEKLNLAFVGVGGRGSANLKNLADQNVVALCDVDKERAAQAFEQHPEAKVYQDFRKMLDEVDKQIDGVVVSTPDHTHAVAVLAAIRRGKHVYCEKPLAHSIREVREILKAAREHKVITQLGNQGHSTESIRQFCEWIWDGAIGKVRTIHAVSAAQHCKIPQLPLRNEKHEVPETLDWDLWLGPAQFRPYHPMYLPGQWRGWMPFGTGAIGDWVCHVVDPVFWAFDLGAPKTILAEAKNYDPKEHGDTFPRGTRLTFEFPAKGDRGPITLFWYDGDEKPPRPEGLDETREVPRTGAIVIGEDGGITYGSHGAGGCRIYPEEKMKAYKRPEKKIPRTGSHHLDWVNAVRNGKPAGSNFDYGGPLTEIALLGIIATKLPGQQLEWDGAKGQFTNNKEANALLNPPYRKGWTL